MNLFFPSVFYCDFSDLFTSHLVVCVLTWFDLSWKTYSVTTYVQPRNTSYFNGANLFMSQSILSH